MKSRNTKKTWKNDEVTEPSTKSINHSFLVNSDDDSDSDSDAYQDIPEGNTPEADYQTLLRGTGNEESASDSDSDDDEENQHKVATLSSKTEVTPEVDEGDEDVIEEGRLFIRNLPYSCKEEEIAEHVKQYGELVDVFIPLNSKRESKGYCFVTFMFPEQAITALEVELWFSIYWVEIG